MSSLHEPFAVGEGPARLIDFHAHFPAMPKDGGPKRDVHPEVLAYQKRLRARWREDFGFPDPERDHPGDEAQADRWYEEAQRHRIERVVFMTGGGNDNLASVVRKHPDRFSGFAHHDLSGDGVLEEMRRSVEELGLVGYKWFGPLMRRPFDDPALTPFWTYLADRKLPVLIHFGVLGGPGGVVAHPQMSPLSIGRVVQTYVDIPFVIPHYGAGYIQDLLQLAWSSPNVYIDASGSNDWIRWMPYPLTVRDILAKGYDTVGPDRMVFGSDSSWFPRGFAVRYLREQYSACRDIGMTGDELDRVYYRNAARLLGI